MTEAHELKSLFATIFDGELQTLGVSECLGITTFRTSAGTSRSPPKAGFHYVFH